MPGTGSGIGYSSSVREVPIALTLERAKKFARRLGITRVTDVTRLDRVGVPVFCSIRPDAQPGSLCVNAGKGLTEEEARIGAYMEAIEFAMAEFGASSLTPMLSTPRALPGAAASPHAVLDFCPLQGRIVPLNGPMQCVEAEDILSGDRTLVPAELVYLPYPNSLPGMRCFGESSNGLASGNSLLEASIHGIAEVIERDINSFQILRNTMALVNESTYSSSIAEVAAVVNDASLKLYVRTCANEFGLPFFKAVISDLLEENPIYVSAGYGCHVDRNIAITRAVCEALQSRLSFIHGGRDDLDRRYAEFEGWSQSDIRAYTNILLARASDATSTVAFDEIPSPGSGVTETQKVFRLLVEALAGAGFDRIYRVAYTRTSEPLQVVRIIIPGLEHFDRSAKRVGPRLRDYARS